MTVASPSPGVAERLVPIPGGEFTMGSDTHYPEERPARTGSVEPFLLGTHPVTVGEFARFVRATGHLTAAEQAGEAAVFVQPDGPVDLAQPSQWWRVMAGASWTAPFGPGSRPAVDQPVTQVTLDDALAYCAWTGDRLPAEAEWERAASLTRRPVGWPHASDGRLLANVWVGSFPWESRRPEPIGPQPVGRFGPDDVGCVDLLGNVWEWTSSSWDDRRQVIKGGSFLCSADYCSRYRPSARLGQITDEPACHLGFRIARDAP